jgi:hypothetical protein
MTASQNRVNGNGCAAVADLKFGRYMSRARSGDGTEMGRSVLRFYECQ